MIRVQGNEIQVIRYKIKSTAFDTEMYMEASTLEEAESLAEQFKGKIETLDTSNIEWVDGITIPETNKPMEAALEILEIGKEGYFNNLKNQAILNSKQKLSNYLANHPVQWTDGKFYSITSEKQQWLTSKLFSATTAKSMGVPYNLTWNDTAEVCTSWTLEDLWALAGVIDTRVTALVTYQQKKELEIRNCNTIKELESVVVDYDEV